MSNRVYEGRFKGNSETHRPNDKFREKMDKMNWPSYGLFICNDCDHTEKVHKLEQKIHYCSKCGGDGTF